MSKKDGWVIKKSDVTFKVGKYKCGQLLISWVDLKKDQKYVDII